MIFDYHPYEKEINPVYPAKCRISSLSNSTVCQPVVHICRAVYLTCQTSSRNLTRCLKYSNYNMTYSELYGSGIISKHVFKTHFKVSNVNKTNICCAVWITKVDKCVLTTIENTK